MEGAPSAQSLVSNVGQLVGDEFRQLRSVGGEVARLRNELATINALLRMQSEADEGAMSHFVREWMKQLREVGYDAEDCVDLYLFRVRSRQDDPFFVRWKRLLTTCWSRHQLAGDIRNVRTLASAINEQHARYGFSLEQLCRRDASSGPVAASARQPLLPADHHSSHHQFVGNKDLAVQLAKKIMAMDAYVADSSPSKQQRPGSSWPAGTEQALNDEGDKQPQPPKVFSIWGFGGLGKTTLALEVCRLLETEFPCQARVSVSQTFSGKDLQGLLKRVLRQIADDAANTGTARQADPLGNIDTMDVGQLESKLKESLQNKRYLILIDDVWRIPAWDTIWSKLPSSICCSRIIVTTRIENVAKACSHDNNDYIHHMEKLGMEDSEQLFISKAFGYGKSCPEEWKGAMESVLKKCGGLPLAIVSIASLFTSYINLSEGKTMWETVQKSIGTQLDTNPTLEGMRQILTLSYNDLPHHLKACMMYLSIFPDDYMICKDRLLKRWIAEGLVVEKRGLTQMELAEGYFNELMSRSMIDKATGFMESIWIGGRREERCKVHDMMLEILVSTSLEANFVSLIGGQYEGISYTSTIRRLSIHGRVDLSHKDSSSSKKNMEAHYGKKNVIKGMMLQHVRSLSIFDPEVNNMLLARLGEFTLLRVLDLEGCKGLGKEHMTYICQMYLLRFLSLRATDIKVIPPRVGDLEHLQTLDVRETDLEDLPDKVTKLEKLEHLLFSDMGASWWDVPRDQQNEEMRKLKGAGWMIPQGINKMKGLCQVNRAKIDNPKAAEEIGELDQLQELAIYVDTRKEMNHQEVVEKLACSLSKMYSLRWLEIGNFGCYEWPFNEIMNFLHEVKSPPRLLQYLKICGCINELPDWVGSLTDLVEFDIAWTYVDSVGLFNVLYKLPNLKRLSLRAYFIRIGQNMVARSIQPFPKLKELILGYSAEVPKLYIFEEGSMPNLETLVVNFGDQGKRIVGIEHLTNLKEVQYSGCRGHKEMKGSVKQLEELNKDRDGSKKITVRARYEDGW